MENFHSIDITELKQMFSTDVDTGLSREQAEKQLVQYGENRLVSKKKRAMWMMLLDQFKDFTVIILIIAAIISMALGEWIDGLVIIGIVILNAALGTYQESKASNALEALKSMASPKVKVIRSGVTVELNSPLLVPGDLVLLEAGDFVPADLRLLEGVNLKIDESALTGESVPVEKEAQRTLSEDTGLGDRLNSAFSGTIVTYGRGKAIVVNTGMKTEIGHIAQMLNEAGDDLTPLQKRLAEFGKLLGIVCLVVSLVIMALGILRQENLLEIFMTAVSLAVAAIPEGLPAVVTTVLALGMQKMVKRHAIMKRLSAVETLGSTTTICSDKTGTLTQNKMTVLKVFTDDQEFDVDGSGYDYNGEIRLNGKKVSPKLGDLKSSLNMLLHGACLCNDATIQNEECIGDPTEGALVVLAQKGGLSHESLRKSIIRINEFPFDSVRKLMSTVHEINGETVMLTKGAPDQLIEKCTQIMLNGQIVTLSEAMKEKLLNQNRGFAQEALRVIGYAMKRVEKICKPESEEVEMTFLGMTGMIDPPRQEAIEAIKICKKAGIRVVMITGDHITTATAIGKQLGIAEEGFGAIEGKQLNGMTDDQLIDLVRHIGVFARVSPEHKVRIVKAIQTNGHVVAMTGDGVNDAPALKNADIGVAMGITGTDVSKEAADMILTDDNFASIVSAVEEGRIIYSNIRKFVGFLLSCNVGEILIIFISMLANWGIPLVPIQLLWVNLITDSFPAFALGLEKGEKGIMDEKPRDKNEPIVDRKMGMAIVLQSIGLAVAVLAAYRVGRFWGIASGAEDPQVLARTFAFSTLIFGEMFRAFSARRESLSIFKFNILSNIYLNLSVLLAVILLLAVIYVPPLQPIFKTTSLSMSHLITVLGFALIPMVFGELAKLFIHLSEGEKG